MPLIESERFTVHMTIVVIMYQRSKLTSAAVELAIRLNK